VLLVRAIHSALTHSATHSHSSSTTSPSAIDDLRSNLAANSPDELIWTDLASHFALLKHLDLGLPVIDLTPSLPAVASWSAGCSWAEVAAYLSGFKQSQQVVAQLTWGPTQLQVQYRTVQYYTAQSSTMQLQSSTHEYSTVQCSTAERSFC
jgi:hypothetical protein